MIAKAQNMPLDKVRVLQRSLCRAAKANPTRKFGVLYDKVCRDDVLRAAYRQVKANGGAPGIDQQTFEIIEKEIGLDVFLRGIKERLLKKRYKPLPVRRVYIPKADGTQRPLGIPVIADRVVQAAVKIVIEPVFEASFKDFSYGFRPRKDAHKALREVYKWLNFGCHWVVDADLKSYFDSIPHDRLLLSVRSRVIDRSVVKLIEMWLKAGVMEEMQVRKETTGTPQGGVITPLTQKVISSSKGQSRVGEQGTRCLTFALRGNMSMTGDAFDQSGKGSAAERRSWPTPASCRFTRSGAALVTRVRSVRASSISVPGGSVRARSAGRSPRAHSADHVEASAEHGGTAAEVREKQGPDHWSDRDRRGERVSRCSKKAWLSRAPKAAHCKSTFPIRLIACSSQSSCKPTIFWSPCGSAPSAGV